MHFFSDLGLGRFRAHYWCLQIQHCKRSETCFVIGRYSPTLAINCSFQNYHHHCAVALTVARQSRALRSVNGPKSQQTHTAILSDFAQTAAAAAPRRVQRRFCELELMSLSLQFGVHSVYYTRETAILFHLSGSIFITLRHLSDGQKIFQISKLYFKTKQMFRTTITEETSHELNN